MLKLLKYDLKRDFFQITGGIVAIVLLLIVIEAGGGYWQMKTDARFVLTVLTYFAAAAGILSLVCNSFRKNIGFVGRRLIPVPSWQYIASAVLYMLVAVLILLLMAGAQFLYYRQSGVLGELGRLEAVNFEGPEGITSLLTMFGVPFMMLWAFLLLMSILFLVIAVAESLRTKSRSLVGIVLFFAIGSLISWVENAFLGGRGTQAITGLRVQNQSVVDIRIESVTAGWAAFVFEAIVAALAVWLTVRLIDRRVQIK